ncbi:MAG: xanthine dehydrogenase family protein molybdopterin-binding subunit [Deltaproteobacteria bacterium]|nr:xanthine dehydrogenase family protein molybdopterin-binding subunit [Deltaproteobacteria bacterium]
MKGQIADNRQEQPRIDSWDKVTGQAKYVEDLPDLPGMAFAANLLSPYSHARILTIDSSKAERFPGVLAVLHRERLEGLNPMLPPHRHEIFKLSSDQSFVATDRVRFDGELVAQVVAEDLRTARRALELIDVQYEVLPPVFDAEEALAPAAVILHEERGTNLLLEDKLEWGDVEQGFKEADRIFNETYTSPAMFHHPMENVGNSVAQFVGDEITLWAPTASPFRDAQEIAHIFGLDPDQVRVRVPYVGGGFGSKILTGSMLAALFISRKIQRPVKVVASAEESFRHTARHAIVYKAKVGVKSDGRLVALDVQLVVDTGAYATGGATVTHNAVISAWGCYRIPHVRCRARCAYTNKVPASHTRATGKVQTTWGVECAMDNVARQMRMDPMDFRVKNVLRRGDFVAKGTPDMDTDYFELMRQAASAIGWDGRGTAATDSGRAAPSRRARGRSLVLSLRHGSQGGGRAYALVSLDSRGILKVKHNAPEIGQGTHNLISVVASKVLEIPQSQIQVGQPDTSISLPFAGVSAQRTTVQMGRAVENGCEKLKQELVGLACQNKGGSPEEWRIGGGRLWRAENSFSFAEIVRTLGETAEVKSIGFHSAARTHKGSAFGGMDHWAPSAAAAEVEVDRETGEVRLLQFSVVADAGKALHYSSARAQVEGGAVMGIGHALFEEVIYQDGQILNADPFQYRLPVMQEVPESFHSAMLENRDGPGPFGSKGMSQTSIVTVAPAIGNAIYDAVGVRIRSLPITPEKILRALGKL